jgi:glycine/D-amino acid oxidase-like deaminating enzyme
MTQGLMLIETLGNRSWFEPHRRVVYLHSLATAPWNRPSIQDPPRYRLVGTMLLRFARQLSEALGYGGLVGLHALPEAEDFYRRMSLIDCGLDAKKENLTYFEWYQRQTSEGEDWQNEVDWDTMSEEDMDLSGGENDP